MDFDDYVDEEVAGMDDDGNLDGPGDDVVGCDEMDSPTDFDEYEMNPDDSFEDPYDPYDIEYDR